MGNLQNNEKTTNQKKYYKTLFKNIYIYKTLVYKKKKKKKKTPSTDFPSLVMSLEVQNSRLVTTLPLVGGKHTIQRLAVKKKKKLYLKKKKKLYILNIVFVIFSFFSGLFCMFVFCFRVPCIKSLLLKGKLTQPTVVPGPFFIQNYRVFVIQS